MPKEYVSQSATTAGPTNLKMEHVPPAMTGLILYKTPVYQKAKWMDFLNCMVLSQTVIKSEMTANAKNVQQGTTLTHRSTASRFQLLVPNSILTLLNVLAVTRDTHLMLTKSAWSVLIKIMI